MYSSLDCRMPRSSQPHFSCTPMVLPCRSSRNGYGFSMQSEVDIFSYILQLGGPETRQILYFVMIKLALLVLLIAVAMGRQGEPDPKYVAFVQDLAAKIKTPDFMHKSYERLAVMTDTFGPRMWGSQVLEMAIDHLKKQAEDQGFDHVRLQDVSDFTKWVRGKQSLTMLQPRMHKLDVTALGGSVSSNTQITAEVIVFSNFDELQQRKGQIQDKIVCFNNPWVDYHKSVEYRVDGASRAAKYGAVAMLVRSVASQSIYSVHTGYMEYNTDVSDKKIPCAAITVEDAEMFARMQDRGTTIKVSLTLLSQFVEGSNSHNLVFEIQGSDETMKDQIVLAGGHIDTWDTGSQTGANDDGGGFYTVFQAFRLLLKNGYRPRRTMRFIAWSGEESGSPVDGAAQYNKLHAQQIPKHVAAFESDLGSTLLQGFSYKTDTQESQAIIKSILGDYLSILNASQYDQNVLAADIEQLGEKGVPTFCNIIKDSPSHDFYFKYHHTAGDSMTMMNPDDMDSNVVGIAAFLYIIADLETTVRQVGGNNLRVQVQVQ